MVKKTLSLEELEIHELAKLTPTMTEVQYNALKASIEEHGQQVPVITYRGKVIDGRHRCKALRELGISTVITESEDSKMSIEDIKEKVMNVYENRRHQTVTQKAILAYREYAESKRTGDKISQGVVAEKYGTTVKQLGRAKSLHKVAGDETLEHLYQGNLINTGSKIQPNYTDSLATLILYFKNRNKDLLENSDKSNINEDFTDEEIELCNQMLSNLEASLSIRMLERLNKMIYYKIKNSKPRESQLIVKDKKDDIFTKTNEI
jgi:hypothetical protein